MREQEVNVIQSNYNYVLKLLKRREEKVALWIKVQLATTA